ncbi:MAG: hypothetical protein IBX44_07980 [Sulfurospirillum sp.]|nr:hypothetical protein [Sulfurospirillum sp.]
MLQELLNDAKFGLIMQKHVKELIENLLEKGISFSILTSMSQISFEPELPDEIKQNFKSITMFVLAGYTFESCVIDEESMSFEAGFGANNFASWVSVPLLGIMQIILDETPIFINLASQNKSAKKQNNGVKRSMEALLSNPENKKLLKK